MSDLTNAPIRPIDRLPKAEQERVRDHVARFLAHAARRRLQRDVERQSRDDDRKETKSDRE
jgi:hypothetical protein